ncbi:MAG: ABC transporter ATP-binding protein [Actinomycetota bacterium]
MNQLTTRIRGFFRSVEDVEGLVASAPPVPVREILSRFWPDTSRVRRRIVLGLSLIALLPAIEVAEIYLFKFVVDDVLIGQALALFPLIAAAYVALSVLSGTISYADELLSTGVGERFVLSVRSRIFGHLLSSSPDAMDDRRMGDVITRFTADVGAIETLIVSGISTLVTSTLRILFFTGAMLFLDWQLALASLAVAPIFWLAARRLSSRIRGAARETRRRSGSLTAFVEQRLSHIGLVRANTAEEVEGKRFADLGEAKVEARVRAARISALLYPLTDLIEVGAAILVLGGGTWALASGRLTLGGLLAFVTYLTQLYRPVRDLMGLSDTIFTASAGAERVIELLDQEEPVRERPGALALDGTRGMLEFDGVTFGYAGADRPVLRGVDLLVEPDELIAISGPSGVGKSTLIKLMLRFSDPAEGSVRLDGHDLRRLRLSSVRRNITVLFQESMILEGTVRDNIAYGKPDATEEEIRRAVERAHAHAFVEALPDGYDTEVGQRGRKLSGGQRQRVALARALLRDAPILVLDEPTTGLDDATARRVMATVRATAQGRTTIVMTHDPRLLDAADRVLELRDGGLVECPRARGGLREALA